MVQHSNEENDGIDVIDTHLSSIDQRIITLGFKPQKEIIYNALLPYAERIDQESNAHLAEIKSQIGRAVLLRDVKIGGIHWVGQLSKYIRLNGMKFSFEDHIKFIKLFFEILSIPGLQYSLIQKYAVILATLLKKQELIPRNSLVLPWRPLYKLLDNVINSPYEHHGMVFFPDNIETTLKNLIRVSRVYFSCNSTQEMLDEWRPFMCPFDIKMGQAMYNFENFLPTIVYPKEHDQTFKLWFDEFISIYCSTVNTPSWEQSFVNLFTRLSHDCVGYVNWEPHLGQIFTRILRNFNLPVGSKKIEIRKSSDYYDVNHISRWIISMLSPTSKTLSYVCKMFKALESYYRPSNHGHWTTKLLKMMSRLSLELTKRLQKEKWRSTKGFELNTTGASEATPAPNNENKHEGRFVDWKPEIPVEARLTEEDITTFVKCISPALMTSMFSKNGSSEAANTFKNLSTVRPEIVIPPLLDQTYSAPETLSEPHKLTACLQCAASVIRSMLTHSHRYPVGLSHVIPLLRLSLPGIDPNDIKKSLMTFQLITTVSSLLPIVDCSQAPQHYKDLSRYEEELCSATADFEGVVLLYFDRVISLIESSSHHHTRTDTTIPDRMSNEELMLELCLLSSTNSLLQQTSRPIFEEVLRKLQNFAIGSAFEIRVSGRFTSKLIKAASKVHPELVLPKFVPLCCSLLIKRLQSEDLTSEEHMDNEILWYLLLLSEIVVCDGKHLVQYEKDIISVLELTLNLKCKDAAELCGNILKNILRSLTSIYAVDYRCTINDWDSPISQYLPIRDWGKSSNLFDLKIKWHEPSPKEKNFALQLLTTFVIPQLRKIRLHCSKDKNNCITLDREDLLRRLNVIYQCVFGACSMLPVWEDEVVNLADSPVALSRFSLIATNDDKGISLEGKNVRLLIADHVKLLLDHMLSHTEDDTKSILVVIKVINAIMNMFSPSKDEFEGRWKARHHIKHFMENKLIGKKKHIRALLVDRVQLQHELRSTNHSVKNFTKFHQSFYKYLFQLSTSPYMEVRRTAQASLIRGFRIFTYSYRAVLDDILSLLHDKPGFEVKHHQFKGALYIILGENKQCLASRRNWDLMKKLWPALVLTPHCEKPSVNLVYDMIIDRIHKDIETNEIIIKVSPECITLAESLWTDEKSLKCSIAKPNARELEAACKEEEMRNETNSKIYYELVNDLVNIAVKENLFWKFQQVCFELLSLMIRHDILIPSNAAELFVKNVNNVMINIRKISIHSVSALLKQQKRPHPKMLFDPSQQTLPFRKTMGPETTDTDRLEADSNFMVVSYDDPIDMNRHSSRRSGLQHLKIDHGSEIKFHLPPRNNGWLMYWKKEVPLTEEVWEDLVLINKTHVGYYSWPKTLTCYQPSSAQPKLGRSRSELSECECPIYDAFTNSEFVDEFIKYISMEEQKGKESFHPKFFTFFKGLFRNYDDTVLPLLRHHIEVLVSDTNHESQESNHRCAAEIIAGLLRGSKHWTFSKREQMWSWLIPVLKQVLYNLSVENFSDWGTCFATASENQDPRKLAPLFDLVMENPLNEVGGSFGDSSRLYLVQGLLSQQEWRVPELLHALLNFLSQHLRHFYKNVRDRIGSLLVNIFLFDISFFPGFPATLNPQLDVFLELLVPQLLPLAALAEGESLSQDPSIMSSKSVVLSHKEPGTVVDSQDVQLKGSESSSIRSHKKTSSMSSDERQKSLIRLFKTILKGLQGVYTRLFQTDHPVVLLLLPVMAALESYNADPELSKNCALTLAIISHGLLADSMVDCMLDAVVEVTTMNSWHARSAILNFLQRLTFENLFVLQDPKVISKIEEILINLLLDEQLEVRELAGVTLSGLFQCGYLPVDDATLAYYKRLSSIKMDKKMKAQRMKSFPNKISQSTETHDNPVQPDTSASAPLPVITLQISDPQLEETSPVDRDLLTRHAGVIGICACVAASPYDVPDYMPDLLVILSTHLNDPQPIQMTVKKTLANFKRTHHENWHDLKQKFTDDQLAILTELLVSPNYYA